MSTVMGGRTTMMPRIYTASKTRHAGKWRDLRAAGHAVCASWIDEECPEDKSKPEIPGLWAAMVREAAGCDAVLMYHEAGEVLKGALIEVGCALAHGKPVYLCGDVSVKALGSWVSHPLVTVCVGGIPAALDLIYAGLPPMTDIDALHAALDAEPWSATLRMVIADELDALGDPLGEGYRTLGLLRLSPNHIVGDWPFGAGYRGAAEAGIRGEPERFEWWLGPDGELVRADYEIAGHTLPAEWLAALEGGWPYQNLYLDGTSRQLSRDYFTRREADDAAAKAFTRLPAATQAAILETAGASV